MVTAQINKEKIYALLASIPDPEIPVVNIIEMGMVRDALVKEDGCEVLLTPTYTGCPAMSLIEQDIRMTLEKNGVAPVKVTMIYSPAWTTDWMTDEVKTKLKNYGIAPPLSSMSCHHGNFSDNIIKCPLCGSADTVMLSRFGSTACKALYQCHNCKEPFEYFKCH